MNDYEISVLTPAEATEILRRCGLRISPEVLRAGIQQKAFPFGTFVQGEKHPRIYIYERQLEEWIRERADLPNLSVQTGTVNKDDLRLTIPKSGFTFI